MQRQPFPTLGLSLRSILAGLLLAAWGMGCDSGSALPPDGSVTCDRDEDCPVGWVCDQGICGLPGGDGDPIPCGPQGTCPGGLLCQDGFCVQSPDGGDGGDGDDGIVDAPDIEILEPAPAGSPPAYVLDFGSVLVGTPVARAVRLRNAGTQPLRILDLVFELGTSPEFSLDPATRARLPISLAPGAETSLEVVYLATDGRNDFGVLAIISNDPDEARVPIQLESTFKGVAAVAVEPTAIDFGDLALGDQARVRLTVSNQGSGNAVLAVSGIRLASIHSPAYGLEGLPAFPVHLNRGDALEIEVVYDPLSLEVHQDAVVVLSDDASRPQVEVALTGRGVQPDLVVDPVPLQFGQVRVGVRAELEVGIANRGQAPLSLTGLRLVAGAEFDLSSDPATGFDLASLSPAAPQELMPGERRLLRLSFSPVSEGARQGVLEVDCPDVTPSTRAVSITGTGVIPPAIGVDPLALDFGDVHVRGDRSLPVVVTNEGRGFLQVPDLQVSGGGGAFQVNPASLPSLGPDDSSAVSVRFSPQVIGGREATLRITSNDPDQPEVPVPLTGNAIDPNIDVAPWPPPLNFGQIYRGQSAEHAVHIRNVGVGPLEITLIQMNSGSSPDFSLVDLPPLPATLHSSSQFLTFKVLYAPPAVGADSGAVRIESSDLDAAPAYLLAVQGEAIGCPAGFWDINGDPSDGCEYPCTLTNNGLEACDGIDNDCDGDTDEDFDLTSHPDHCGACNRPCVYQNASGLCQSSTCVLGPCRTGYWDANGDPADGCEYPCVLTNNGVERCDGLDNDCDGDTDEGFDLATDELNCGACGNICDLFHASSECQESACRVLACDPPWENCDGQHVNGCERDLQTDPLHCNGCGNECFFPNAPALCVAGVCTPGDCSTPFVDCDGLPGNGCETNTHTSWAHCGGCDQPCSDPAEACVTGACRCGSVGPDCAPNQLCCGITCVNPLSDPAYCGNCATACLNPRGTTSCQGGVCAPICDPGGGDCDSSRPNGCETNLWLTGGCGTTCANRVDCNQQVLSATGPYCASGACDYVQCLMGTGDCDTNRQNGCEINLQSSLSHCGQCGNPCLNPHGGTACSNGVCTPACDSGWGDCDASRPNGCETDLWLTASCGTTCVNRVHCGNQIQNATGPSCASGLCDYALCLDGYGNCDANRTNGCEANIWQIASCGTTCANRVDCTTQVQNASGKTCASGNCDYDACAAGFADCNGSRPDGCETNIWQTASCGTGCTGRVNCNTQVQNANNPTCSGGACDYASCLAGFASCDADRTNGCEVNTTNTTNHCGACGTQCVNPNGSTACIGSVCAPTCNPGYGDCDSSRPNGCEASIWQTASCGTTCANRVNCGAQVQNATGTTCAGGTCDYTTCNAGYGDCDTNRANGCETNTTHTTNHCGACGTQCVNPNGSTACVGSACAPTCNPGYGDCDSSRPNGCEANIWQPASCGTTCTNRVNCGAQVQNASGISCAGGTCDYTACNAGFGDCDSNRANGCETDLWQTASCGTLCSNRVDCNTQVQSASGKTCASGACDYTSCSSGFGDCDSNRTNGCERDLWQLTACGTNCTNAINCSTQVLNATGKACASGACDYTSCSSGFGDCDSNRTNGCETSIWQTASCGTLCSNRVDCTSQVQNASGKTCASGACDYTACSSGYGDCDSNRTNGCEASIWQTASCGTTCGTRVNCSAQVQNATGITCASGACDYTACNAGYGDCDGNRANGCEASIWQTASCGLTCGTRVNCNTAAQNATGQFCSGGVCDYAACNSGYGDCDGSRPNGCEVNIWQTASCGTTCANRVNCSTQVQNAAGKTCASGACDYTSCNAGYGDCDTNRQNGCEVNTTHTTAHCGACGTACTNAHGTTACIASTCTPTCDTGWGSCDSNPNNGCETDTTSSVAHCGGCGLACNLPNATPTCVTSTCVVQACDAGTWNVDGANPNGCECVDTSDIGNACGSPLNVGTVSYNTSASRSGVLVHKTGLREDMDCYQVAYSRPNPGTGTFRIHFNPDPGNLAIQVWKGSCATQVCAADTVYETACYSLPGAGHICQSGNSDTFFACVKAATGQNNLCQSYTIRFISLP
jgi:hypothetical protein